MTHDLRDRMLEELDRLDPMPDLVPGAVRRGAGIVRRRRLAVGSLLGVAALGGGAALTSYDGTRPDRVPVAGDTTPTPTPTPTPSPTGDVDGTVAWSNQVGVAVAALPGARGWETASFTVPAEVRAMEFLLESDGQSVLRFNVDVRPGVSSSATCDDITDMKPGQETPTCRETTTEDGAFVVASSVGGEMPVTQLTSLDGDVETAVNFFWVDRRKSGELPLPVADLIAWGETPEFAAMVTYALDHAAELEGVAVFPTVDVVDCPSAAPNEPVTEPCAEPTERP